MYDVTIDDSFFNLYQSMSQVPQEEISKNITIEESLTAQQQTLLWNEEKYLPITPGEVNVPRSLLFDQNAEELSFPAIYLGHFRNFREGVKKLHHS
ncbi:ATP-dependent DNA helicase [Trichonephila clavipes]|nr:ATP-dependent DNA helicase [Trichonephila clavipes]